MALQRLPLTLLIFSSLCCSSFSSSHENPPYDNNLLEMPSHDSQAYPSYFNIIKDDVHLESKISSLKRLDGRGNPATSAETVNVSYLGAKGDGTDDTEAFKKAWERACSSSKGGVLVVPKSSNYHLKPIRFSGPCKSSITVQIYGTLQASSDRSNYDQDRKHWLVFDSVENLSVQGGGTIDGNGNIWWQNSCKINKALPCKDAPTALTFYKCNNLILKNLKVQNAQQMHVIFDTCTNVQASSLTVTAPAKSPNTDGIHVTNTQNIQITNSVIGTGDDCISIVSGSQKVQIKDITCGPGHGISIGSLGSENSEAYVSNVVVNGAKFSGTANGVRIKTWQGGSGTASNIKFQNLEMYDVTNPIIIDQNYCDQDKPCKEQSSAVQVKNVVYQNIKGTSASDVAIKFDCSKSFPCQGIVLQGISIARGAGKVAKAVCSNVKLTDDGAVSPLCP